METKKCKECQTDIPQKAKRCPNCKADLRSWFRKHPLFVISFIFFLFIAVTVNEATKNVEQNATSITTAQSSRQVSVGEKGYLRAGGLDEILVPITEEAFEKYSKSAIANDTTGMVELITKGQAMLVKAGTKVLVIDNFSLGAREIRILEGDFASITGFVPMEYIHKQ